MENTRKVNRINKYGAFDKQNIIKEVKQKYLNEKKSLNEISKEIGVSRFAITKWLKEEGVIIIPPGEAGKLKSKIHNYEENYFENINNPNKAYILGFIVGDGCISNETKRKRLKIAIAESDLSLLEEIAKELKADNLIKIREKQKTHWQNQASLTINSTKMCNDLINLGVTERKTGFEKFVKFEDTKLTWAFIRGLFDADGCIVKYNDNRRKFGIVSNEQILIDIKNFFNKEGIETSPNAIYPKKGCYEINVWKKSSIEKICSKMYESGDIKLDRKYDKFF
jgi:intein/homing endonuclease